MSFCEDIVGGLKECLPFDSISIILLDAFK